MASSMNPRFCLERKDRTSVTFSKVSILDTPILALYNVRVSAVHEASVCLGVQRASWFQPSRHGPAGGPW